MTQAYHYGMEHPAWKFLFAGALGATALHLSKLIPKQYDVFYAFKDS